MHLTHRNCEYTKITHKCLIFYTFIPRSPSATSNQTRRFTATYRRQRDLSLWPFRCRDWDWETLCSVYYHDEWCSLNAWEYQLAVKSAARWTHSFWHKKELFIRSSFFSPLQFWLFIWISRRRFIIENDVELLAHPSPWESFPMMHLSRCDRDRERKSLYF